MTRQWMIPGGGLEEGETLEECCIREMSEEAGVVVSLRKKYLTIIEYFDHMNFVNHYYLAEYVRDTERSLTENELAVGMEPRWIDLDDMIKIFSKYEQYNDTDQLRSGLYRREYKALSCLKALIQNKLL
jgi:8-oxo-dGTP pyrophosphatase MutT (NUDIX family)